MEKSFLLVSPVSSAANKKSDNPEIYCPLSKSNLSTDHSDNSLMNRPLCSELSCTDAKEHKEGHECIGFTEVTSSSCENIDKCGGYEDSDLELSLGLSLWVGDNVPPESIGTMQHAGILTKREFNGTDTFSEERSTVKKLIGVKRSYNEAITPNACRTRQAQFKKSRQENPGIDGNNLSLYWNKCRWSQPFEMKQSGMDLVNGLCNLSQDKPDHQLPGPVAGEPPTKNQATGWPPIRACRRKSLDSHPKPCGEKQAVGWPPIQAYRKNSLGSHPKSCGENQGNSRYVKVNMDGVAIGRKVDLSSHESYETLVQDLENMFQSSTESQNGSRTSLGIHYGAASSSMRLLDRSSDMVLTYEDKEGDCMLVGDIPWKMFVNTVKRLRIMKTSEAYALA